MKRATNCGCRFRPCHHRQRAGPEISCSSGTAWSRTAITTPASRRPCCRFQPTGIPITRPHRRRRHSMRIRCINAIATIGRPSIRGAFARRVSRRADDGKGGQVAMTTRVHPGGCCWESLSPQRAPRTQRNHKNGSAASASSGVKGLSKQEQPAMTTRVNPGGCRWESSSPPRAPRTQRNHKNGSAASACSAVKSFLLARLVA